MIRSWRKVDEMYLRDNWGKMDIADIARTLKRTSNSCRQKARALGLCASQAQKAPNHQRMKDKPSRPANREEQIHLDRVSQLSCAVASEKCKGKIEVHHVRKHASKRDHKRVMPLCEHHHRDNKQGYHGMGRENFNAEHGIDCCEIAERLWNDTCNLMEAD